MDLSPLGPITKSRVVCSYASDSTFSDWSNWRQIHNLTKVQQWPIDLWFVYLRFGGSKMDPAEFVRRRANIDLGLTLGGFQMFV